MKKRQEYKPSGPLEKVKVLELGAWVAAPSTGAVLGDWGAEVIKIEDPVTGDPVRGWKSIRGINVTDIHFWFEVYNRNKKSIGIDLKSESGKDIFYRLVLNADVFISNFRYSALNKLKVDYKTLSGINPKLIYAIISGYGKKGQDIEKPGYDLTAFWARSGILFRMTPAEQALVIPPHAMGDTISGTFMAGAISAALFNRERTGLGQEVDLSLFHAAVWSSAMDVETILYKGIPIPKPDRTEITPLENYYVTKDGKWLLVVMIQSDKFWPDFCRALNIEHLRDDDRFKDAVSRAKHNKEIISILDDIFITKTCAQWEKIFRENELICAPAQTFTDLIDDAQAIENNFFTEVMEPSAKKIKIVNTPQSFSQTPAKVRHLAPELGQHTEEILLDLGYTWDDIVNFKEKQVIN